MAISQNILKFNQILSNQNPKVPDGFKIINPFKNENKDIINKIAEIFYNKYYNDNNFRYLILCSSPAKNATAMLGIPFENSKHLEIETGININKKYSANKLSQKFLYEVIKNMVVLKNFIVSFI